MEENNAPKKLSYEELKQAVGELTQQNRQLSIMLQQSNMTNAYKHLDYLFKVLENKDCFSSDFVIECVDNIVKIMSPEEEEDAGKEA